MICFSWWLKTVQDNFSSRSANSISPQSDVLFSQGQMVCKIFSIVMASSENFNSLQVRFADCQKQLVGHPKLEPNARLPVVDGPVHCLSSSDTSSLPLTADSTPIHHCTSQEATPRYSLCPHMAVWFQRWRPSDVCLLTWAPLALAFPWLVLHPAQDEVRNLGNKGFLGLPTPCSGEEGQNLHPE